jgi:ABC-type bacteriocin/lantibiotic exporter with double-glycine peptidase domain
MFNTDQHFFIAVAFAILAVISFYFTVVGFAFSTVFFLHSFYWYAKMTRDEYTCDQFKGKR